VKNCTFLGDKGFKYHHRNKQEFTRYTITEIADETFANVISAGWKVRENSLHLNKFVRLLITKIESSVLPTPPNEGEIKYQKTSETSADDSWLWHTDKKQNKIKYI
jgi:hypothetical protein